MDGIMQGGGEEEEREATTAKDSHNVTEKRGMKKKTALPDFPSFASNISCECECMCVCGMLAGRLSAYKYHITTQGNAGISLSFQQA